MAGKRSIFEEVGSDVKSAAPPAVGVIDAPAAGGRGAIRLWLAVLFVLAVAMIAVGGMTRLTDSGLSITEWRPVTGAVPPMSDADWQAEYEKYAQTPEFQLQNKGMTLDAFKSIYWWEWGHRQLGRVIGLVWAAGFALFALTKRIPPGWTGRLLALGALGGAQGAIGWWMVHSGLQGTMTDVASYRLAVHLGLAFAILGLIAWYIQRLARTEAELLRDARQGEGKLFSMSTGLMHFAMLQILLGALVAGLDAGRGYTDWPLMGGEFLPSESFALTPAWTNFFENPALVQFIHRMSGYLLAAFGVVVWLRGRRSAHPVTRATANLMALMLATQVGLGIVTVLHGAPLALGLAHQIGAVVLWVMILRLRFLARYPVVASIRGTK
ncbi:MAG: heme A synthase [Paracoccaceae bacterium]